jgi:TPR repeat protein/tRNA A-37 threonylcarbamoyl transferase component Bud32
MSKKVKTIVEQQLVCADCGKPVALGKPRSNVTRFLFRESRCSCIEKDIQTAPPAESGEGVESEPEPDLKAVEATLGARYEVLSLIGRGGMGVVYKVRDKELDKIFAIKMLDASLVASQHTRKRFQQESKAASQLTHANLCAVYDFGGGDSGAPFIVMDYLDGTTLAEILKRDGALSKDRALPMFAQICEGIAHAHSKGVVHRDIKPENIMITRENDLDVVKVVDFGIAQVLTDELRATQRLTKTGDLFGSPFYMSPEQCLGNQNDVRSDIYALGCLLYETLTGDPPLVGENPIRTILKHINEEPIAPSIKKPRANISPGLDQIIMRCLEKQPTDRYQTAADLLQDVEALQVGRPLQKRHGRNVAKAVQRASRSWALPAVVAAGLLIVAVAATIIQRNQEVPAPPPVPSTGEISPAATADELAAIGAAYQKGDGVELDYHKAAKYFEEAGKRGSSNAWIGLGLMYEDGSGMDVNHAKAAQCYRKAAEAGNMIGQHNLAIMYEEGRGVAKDQSRAIHLYRQAAAQGYGPSQVNLGYLYEHGINVPKDYTQALEWYVKGAAYNHPTAGQAAHNIGVLYENGSGVPKDLKKAFAWYTLALQKGNPGELSTVAVCYLDGIGVAVDETQAAILLKRAAETGDVSACEHLGDLYETGRGVEKDYSLAAQYYYKAAVMNSFVAKYKLAKLWQAHHAPQYEPQIRQVSASAFADCKPLAEKGYPYAQFALGQMYEFGIGTSKDLNEAMKWYKKAAEGGDPDAKKRLNK